MIGLVSIFSNLVYFARRSGKTVEAADRIEQANGDDQGNGPAVSSEDLSESIIDPIDR